MTYDETVELEKNVKIKNEADEIFTDFHASVILKAGAYIQGEDRFRVGGDSNNDLYIKIRNGHFVFQCRFLHESYDVTVTPSSIFSCIQNKYRGLDHLKSYIRGFKATTAGNRGES